MELTPEFITGIATILAGIITAIVHIIITRKASKAAENISELNAEQQKNLYIATKRIDLLYKKSDAIESTIRQIDDYRMKVFYDENYNIKPDMKSYGFNDLNIVIFIDFFKKINHYLNSDLANKLEQLDQEFEGHKKRFDAFTENLNTDFYLDEIKRIEFNGKSVKKSYELLNKVKKGIEEYNSQILLEIEKQLKDL